MKVHQAAEKKKIHLQLQSCNTHTPCHVFICWRKAKRKALISLSCRPEPRYPYVFRCQPSRYYNSRRNHVLFCFFFLGVGRRCSGFGTRLVSKQFQGNLLKVAGQKPIDAPPPPPPTGLPDARGAPQRWAAAIWRPGVPSDQLRAVQWPTVPLLLRLRLWTRLCWLLAQDGRPH